MININSRNKSKRDRNIVYDTDTPHTPKSSSKKGKDSVSSLVDNIFSDINGSFFLDPKRKKRKTSISSETDSTSNEQSLSRCGKSYAVLQDSNKSEITPDSSEKSTKELDETIHSISGPAISLSPEDSAINILDNIFFPNIPATVSNSSCVSKSTSNIMRDNVASSPIDTLKKDSTKPTVSSTQYGWFVQIDEAEGKCTTQPSNEVKLYNRSSAMDELAFKAPTAPKRVNDEAELEWASAADTVDNVLGDIF